MSTAWITLIIAGLLEVGWAIGIKYTDGFNFRTRTLASVLTLAAMIASMYLLAQAIRTIPVGTGYAIWTGIGALGAATLGIFLFQEPATLARIACLLMLVFGIVGLKLTTPMAHGGTQLNAQAELFISGYGKGIYASTLDPASKTLGEPKLVAELASASFIAAHPSLPILYSVSEVGGGVVVALSRQADGTYKEISRQSSGGNGPCHLSVHPNGRAIFVANYGDGTVSMLPLRTDGTFEEKLFTDQHVGSGPNEKRQAHAYAHSIYPHPDGKHILSADLGCDAIFVYTADFDRGELTEKREVKIAAGAGPRHLAFSADGRFVYVVTELANTVEVLRWNDANAELTSIQSISTLPAAYKDVSYCAEIRIHPSGRFLYASNRGHDSIATFRIDQATGHLEFVCTVSTEGMWPRGFEVDPTGRYLIVANQRSDSVVLFAIDEKTGVPAVTGATLTIEKPACVRFVDSRP